MQHLSYEEQQEVRSHAQKENHEIRAVKRDSPGHLLLGSTEDGCGGGESRHLPDRGYANGRHGRICPRG